MLACLLVLLLLPLLLPEALVAVVVVRLTAFVAGADGAEVGALLGVLGLPAIFLPLIGILSIPRTSSKFAPMLESKPSAEVLSFCSTASGFDFDLCFLFLG